MARRTVVAFSGHRIDAAGRDKPRFPAAAERAVHRRILGVVRSWNVSAGYSSVADGSDLLFIEALREAGAESHVVLPHPPHQFVDTSVDRLGPGEWAARFEEALAAATTVTVLASRPGGKLAYQFASVVLAGLARLHASHAGGDARGLVVWDRQPGTFGGTASAAADWLHHGMRVDSISPSPADHALTHLHAGEIPRPSADSGGDRIVSILAAAGGHVAYDSVSIATAAAFDALQRAAQSSPMLHSGPALDVERPRIEGAGIAPGVYCSEAHAALVALDCPHQFSCEATGIRSDSANDRIAPAYRVRRGAA